MHILPPSLSASPNTLPALSREGPSAPHPSHWWLPLSRPHLPSTSLLLSKDSTSQLSSFPALYHLWPLPSPNHLHGFSILSHFSFAYQKWLGGESGDSPEEPFFNGVIPSKILWIICNLHSLDAVSISCQPFSPSSLAPWPRNHPSLLLFSLSMSFTASWVLVLFTGFLPVYLSAYLPQGPACLALPTPETTLSLAFILAPWRELWKQKKKVKTAESPSLCSLRDSASLGLVPTFGGFIFLGIFPFVIGVVGGTWSHLPVATLPKSLRPM